MAEAPVQQPGDIFAALENNLRPIKGLEVSFFLACYPLNQIMGFFIINLLYLEIRRNGNWFLSFSRQKGL